MMVLTTSWVLDAFVCSSITVSVDTLVLVEDEVDMLESHYLIINNVKKIVHFAIQRKELPWILRVGCIEVNRQVDYFERKIAK